MVLPILIVFWTFSPRLNEKAKFSGKPAEHYLGFSKESDQIKYKGKKKTPMATFHEMYFDSLVDFKGSALDILEYVMTGQASLLPQAFSGTSFCGWYPS